MGSNDEFPRVLITGGSNGIGAAIAARCRNDGYLPIILDQEGDDSIQCDLSDVSSTKAALEKALEGGPITRLVNNVGAVYPNSILEQSVEEFNAAIALNLRSAFLCTQFVIPEMRKRGFGRIVTVSSRAAYGKLKRTAYSASKAGLLGMTRTWALEEAKYGITSNAICPGPIATDLFRKANTSEESLEENIPVGRLGTAQEVAHSVSFLLHKDSGFITGQNLNVCGGMTVGIHGF